MNPRIYAIQAQAAHADALDKKEGMAHGRLFTPQNSRVTSVVNTSIAINRYEVTEEMRITDLKEPGVIEPRTKCCTVM